MKDKIVSRKNQLRSIFLMIFLMIITVIVILKEYSYRELEQAAWGTNPRYLLAGICLMFFYAGCQGINFNIIMKRLGQTVSYKNCIEYAYIGNYFGAITPGASGGQPAQVYYMNKDNLHVDISAITIFLMIFISQIVIIFMGGILAFLRYGLLTGSAHWFIYLLLVGSVVMIGLTLILSALMFSRTIIPFLMDVIFKLGQKLHIIKNQEEVRIKFDVLIISYREKAKIILKHPDLFVKVFIVTAFQWVAFCLVAYLVYLSFGYTKYNALDLIAGQSFINIAAAAVPLPGSVGIAEKSFLIMYSQFYPQQDLASAMLLNRIINFYLPLLISFLVYLFTHHRIMKAQRISHI